MFWATLTSIYGCVLLFIRYRNKSMPVNRAYFSGQHLTPLCLIMGLASLCLSLTLWWSLFGWQQGSFYFAACLIINAMLLACIRPNIGRLIACSVTLIGSSFIYSTASIVTNVIG